jgi:hypothetical protein
VTGAEGIAAGGGTTGVIVELLAQASIVMLQASKTLSLAADLTAGGIEVLSCGVDGRLLGLGAGLLREQPGIGLAGELGMQLGAIAIAIGDLGLGVRQAYGLHASGRQEQHGGRAESGVDRVAQHPAPDRGHGCAGVKST